MSIKKNNHLIIPQTHNFNKKPTIKTIYNKVLVKQQKNDIPYMYKIPHIISSYDVLELYGINYNAIIYYDSFRMKEYNSNSDNEDEIPFDTLNKVFNSWIYENFSVLKNHNTILNEPSYVLLSLTIPDNFMNEESLKKNIKDYIKYWFDEKNSYDSNFDLINDMNNYFNKKFKK
jgi:hypothetical protein